MTLKRIVFSLSFILSVILIILNNIGTFKLCGGVYHASSCIDVLFSVIASSVIVFPIFVFSLITYKMREDVFRAWLHFAYWWVPLTIFISLLSLNSSYGGGGLGPVMQDWYMSSLRLALHILFIIISLIIIAWKYFSTRSR